MKKFLSLVLALVMTMSLVTVSAGAKDFTDDSEITYKEAVDVISALGVVDGYSGGDFRPDDVLTRGAAAKIICNLILGPTTASALSAGTAPFKDVPVTNTFAGYITYCSQQGIISGYADGTFRPTGTLSGNAFMKMLLGALGYDSSIEGYTGANWTVSVIKQAVGIGLDDGNDEFVGSKAVTRQEAALYAYNMLQATMVEYDQKNTIVVGDITIDTVSTRSEVKNEIAADNTIAKDGKMQFAERYFSDLKKVTSDESDEFERPATTWKLKSTTIGTYADKADLTYTAEVEIGDIYKDLDLSSSLKASEVEVYRNGSNADGKDEIGLIKSDSTKLGGNGVLTEVFYNDDDDTAVITMIDTYLGEVTSTHKASGNRDAYISISPKADGVGVGGNFDTEESFDVDDLVLYTYSNKSGDKGIQTVINASETVTGTLKSFTTGKSVKVADTTYKGTAAYKDQIASLDNAVDQDVTVYLDEYGYVVYIDTDAVTGNYAVVLGRDDSNVGNRAKVLFMDGSTAIVNVSKYVGKPNMYDIVSYTKSSSNEYKLTLLAQDADSSKGDGKTKLVENGESGLTDTAFSNANKGTSDKTTASYANGKTTFLIATSGSNGTEYRVYEGIKNVPDVVISSGKTIEVSTYVEKGNAARVIFINATTDATVSGSSDDIVFIKGSGTGASYDSKLGTYYEYDAIINGEFTTIKTADRFKTSGLYNIVSYDKNGVATNLDKDSNVKSGTGTERVKNDVVGLGDGAAMKYYAYSKDCQVFHLDEDGDIDETVYTVSNIATDNNDKVWYVMDSGDVIAIVYQDVPDDNNTYYTVTFTGFSGNTYIQNVNGENISDVQKVVEGKDFQFKLAPVAGKSVASVKVGSETLTPDSNGVYTVSNVKKDIQIDLTFSSVVELTVSNTSSDTPVLVTVGGDTQEIAASGSATFSVTNGGNYEWAVDVVAGKTVTATGTNCNIYSSSIRIAASGTPSVSITVA